MGRGSKPAKSKVASKPDVGRKSSHDDPKVRDLEKRLAEALRDKAEAQEQQAATAEILRVISSSPSDLQPVLDAVAENATRVCSASDAVIRLLDHGALKIAAHYGPIPVGQRLPVTRGSLAGRAVMDRHAIHVEDMSEAPADEFPEGRTSARRLGIGTALATPLLREGAPIGVIVIRRNEVRAFSDKQVALLQIFADQAVIAIENVRLFNETKDALERQTATSEILRVISSSPTDVQPVFDAIVRSATLLCGAMYGTAIRFDGELLHLAAGYNHTPEVDRLLRQAHPMRPSPRSMAGRAILAGDVAQVEDALDDRDYMKDVAQAGGFRSMLAAPLLRDGRPIGAIVVNRGQPGPFSRTHIDLLKTFADQAVIAIENVRLFKELQASNREIEDKSRQIEVASQHKSEFLANMSHELRTPLNAIIGFSEVLTDRMFGELNEKQEEYLKDIYSSGTHLLSLINDILDLSKIEAGRMELELTDFHLPTALDNALMLVRERAGRRAIALEMNVDERLDQVRADERKVRQVVLNLLSNAIKFTPEGGRIEVGAVQRNGFVEVSVSDTGVGIAPEDQEAVFEEFRQVGTAEKKAEGTGLGLTLCRKFIELHGGRIFVRSQLGVGSTFTFSLPVRCGE